MVVHVCYKFETCARLFCYYYFRLICFYFQQQQGISGFWRVLINMQIVVYHSESYVRMVYWFLGEEMPYEKVSGRKVERRLKSTEFEHVCHLTVVYYCHRVNRAGMAAL